MSTHRGRRDNGLDAADFLPLGDVDPRVGEHLLDLLGLAGIAAYLAPTADLNPVVRATILPSRPTDRLWVDRDRLDGARELFDKVDKTDSGRLSLDMDAEWDRIVAALQEAPDTASSVDAKPSDTASSDTGPSLDAGTGPDARTAIGRSLLNRDGPDFVAGPTTAAPLPESEDEGYTPPPPPPLPRLSRQVALALLAIAAGLVLFFRPGILGIDENLALVVGVGGILGGFGALVYQLRDGWSDDDPDDGAIV